jgi:hypothetical protein
MMSIHWNDEVSGSLLVDISKKLEVSYIGIQKKISLFQVAHVNPRKMFYSNSKRMIKADKKE